MAEGFFNHYNKNPDLVGISAGTSPSESIKPLTVEVMKEKKIDISNNKPKSLTEDLVNNAQKIFTMGCIKSCPITPKEITEDWNLEDPAGKPIEKFREIRDIIEKKVKDSLS